MFSRVLNILFVFSWPNVSFSFFQFFRSSESFFVVKNIIKYLWVFINKRMRPPSKTTLNQDREAILIILRVSKDNKISQCRVEENHRLWWYFDEINSLFGWLVRIVAGSWRSTTDWSVWEKNTVPTKNLWSFMTSHSKTKWRFGP